MRGKNGVTIGFIAMMAVTGIVNAPSSLALEIDQVAFTERIEHGGSTYQSRSGPGSVNLKFSQ